MRSASTQNEVKKRLGGQKEVRKESGGSWKPQTPEQSKPPEQTVAQGVVPMSERTSVDSLAIYVIIMASLAI